MTTRAAVLAQGDETLPQVVGRLLVQKGQRLAVAESCTGGGLGALVTEAAGSSRWFSGGFITYDDKLKERLLDVDPAILARHGAVSEACAEAMAVGTRRALDVDFALSITGIAGPGGGTAAKPVGTVCFGLAGPQGSRAHTVNFGDRGRDLIRQLSSAHALEWLRRSLAR